MPMRLSAYDRWCSPSLANSSTARSHDGLGQRGVGGAAAGDVGQVAVGVGVLAVQLGLGEEADPVGVRLVPRRRRRRRCPRPSGPPACTCRAGPCWRRRGPPSHTASPGCAGSRSPGCRTARGGSAPGRPRAGRGGSSGGSCWTGRTSRAGLSPASLAACRARTKYFCAVGWSPTSYDIQPASSASSAATLNSRRVVGSGWGSWRRSVTSCSWPTTALRRRPPPHWASHWRNITVVDSEQVQLGPGQPAAAAPAAVGLGRRGVGEAGAGTSQRCMGSMRAGPADRASEVPRKPRRASIRSLRENSLMQGRPSAGPSQGRSTPDADGDWRAARRPRSSTETTQPNRSENSSDRIRGIGSRGFSPSSQRRTREVSVRDVVGAQLAGPAVDLAGQLALGPAAAHEPGAEQLVGALVSVVAAVALPPLPPTGTPPSLRPLVAECAKPYQNAGKYGRPSAGCHPSNGKPTLPPAYPRAHVPPGLVHSK